MIFLLQKVGDLFTSRSIPKWQTWVGAGWLIGSAKLPSQLAGGLANQAAWLVGLWFGWLAGLSAYWMVGWLAGKRGGLLAGWHTGWQAGGRREDPPANVLIAWLVACRSLAEFV